MPATALRCRNCETQLALDPVGVCNRCFGPLDPVYDRDEQRRTVSRESIAAGPPSIWRYAPLLPVAAPAEQRLAPGLTPLVAAPRLASALGVRELWLKLDTANPTHSFKDRVVAVACAKALELGYTTLACSSTGNLANAVAARAAAEGIEAAVLVPADLEPEKLIATAVYGATIFAVNGSYDDCSRLSVELSFELDWAFVNVELRAYYAEGLEDARVRDRRAAGLGVSRRGRRADRVRRDVLQGAPGLRRAARARARRGRAAARVRRPGGRMCAGRDGVRRGRRASSRSSRTRSRARSPSAAPPTATSPSPPRTHRAGRSTRSPRRRSPRTSGFSPRRRASSARRRRPPRSAHSAKPSAGASSARRTASCCSSPATA